MTIRTRLISSKESKADVYVITKTENGQTSVIKVFDYNKDGVDSDDYATREGDLKWKKSELSENIFKKYEYKDSGSRTRYEGEKKITPDDVILFKSGDEYEIRNTKEFSVGSLADEIGYGKEESAGSGSNADSKSKSDAAKCARDFSFFGFQGPTYGTGGCCGIDPRMFMGDTINNYTNQLTLALSSGLQSGSWAPLGSGLSTFEGGISLNKGASFGAGFGFGGGLANTSFAGLGCANIGEMFKTIYNGILDKMNKCPKGTSSSNNNTTTTTDATKTTTTTSTEKKTTAESDAEYNKNALQKEEDAIRNEATELGLKDAETADIATLKAEIKAKKEENEKEFTTLKAEAKTLGIEVAEDDTAETLKAKIDAKKEEVKAEKITKTSSDLAEKLHGDIDGPLTSSTFGEHISKIDKENVSNVLDSYKGESGSESLIKAISDELCLQTRPALFSSGKSYNNKEASITKIGNSLIEKANELKIDTTEFKSGFAKELKSQIDSFWIMDSAKLDELVDDLNEQIKEKQNVGKKVEKETEKK